MAENSLQRLNAARPVDLARLHRPHDAAERRSSAPHLGMTRSTGMTSNPTIFEKALAEGTTYDDQIRSAPGGPHRAWSCSSSSRRPTCATRATSSRGVHEQTKGDDGFVSIEVSPGAANDARRHDRRGVATLGDRRSAERDDQDPRHRRGREGGAAARSPSGINVNITLLFSIDAYKSRDRRLHRRASRIAWRRASTIDDDSFGRELLREPRRLRSRQAPRRRSKSAPDKAERSRR